jgi:hypothetical protein
VDLGQFRRCFQVQALDFALTQVPPCSGADVCKTIPFIHAEFSDSNFNIETVVVLYVDSALAETFSNHILMSSLAALDFRD